MPLAHQPSSTIGLRSFLATLWRRKLVFLGVLALVVATVAIGLAVAPRSYTAVSRVAATPPADASESPASYEQMLGTLAAVAESRPVLAEVQEQIPTRSLEDIQRAVQAEVVSGTVIVQVTVTDSDPVVAAQVANAVAELLPAYDPTDQFEIDTTEAATVPPTFTSPDLRIATLAGALLALALATVAAVVYDRLRRTVDTPQEVAATTGRAVLGVVPGPRHPGSLPAADPESREFAALRALRVALEFASSAQPTRTLVVAPATSDPWGGWLEVNLAASLAEVGHRVLLVDANRTARRRHPALEADGHPGLYDMLAGTVGLDGGLREGPVEGVAVLPLGNVDLAAPSLLEMRFRGLMEEIDEKYDVVLIHAAPVLESDDARIMAIAGSLLLTVPVGKVRPRALDAAVGALSDVGIRMVGSVLLGARSRR